MKENKTFVFTIGVYDNFHVGHLNILERASKFGDCLIVGLVNDKAVKLKKGKDRPLHNEKDRGRIIKALKCVDRVHLIHDFDPNIVLMEYENYNINRVYVFGEDQDHLKKVDDRYIKQGCLVITLPRTPNISTTNIIERMNNASNIK